MARAETGPNAASNTAAPTAAEARRAIVAMTLGRVDADIDLFVGQNGGSFGDRGGDGAKRVLNLRLVEIGSVFDARRIGLVSGRSTDSASSTAAAHDRCNWRGEFRKNEFTREVDDHQRADGNARDYEQRHQPTRHFIVRADSKLMPALADGGHVSL